MPTPSPRFRGAGAVLLAALAMAVGSCGTDRPTLAGAPERFATVEPTTTIPPTSTTEAPEPERARRAEAHDSRIEVYATEDATEPEREIVAGVDTSATAIPVVFLVKSTGPTRVEVYLPVRPNGSVGWVDAGDVTITTVPYRVQVSVAEHRLRVYDDGELIVDEPVGVGRADLPTPGGIYYLKELLQPPTPNGTYGTYAYGLSGFSNVLESFNGGSGVIGIHGTNDPSSIGKDVSHGCIRLDNAVIERLVQEIGLPLGTPVEILG